MDLAKNLGALPLAIDAGITMGAKNSLEKMLAHQLAVLHKGSMRLMQQVENLGSSNNVERMRTIGTATRMMATFQSGLEVHHRMKTGNRQTVVVKHVHHVQNVQVNEGGQAVVAGKVKGTKRRISRKAN
jgi:hypothetical protein